MNKKLALVRRFALVPLVAAVLAAMGTSYAAFALYTAPGAIYLGHWTWNDADTNTATVQVLLKAAPERPVPPKAAPPNNHVCIRNFKVEVGAGAQDGSFVSRSVVLQVPENATRKVTLTYDRTLTSLQFIKILALPGGGAACDPT